MSVTHQKTQTYQPVPSPLKWHGGKGGFHGKLAKWIVSLMPIHTTYVEPFFGGGSVLLCKNPRGVSEIVNDLHGPLSGFWRTLQNPPMYDQFVRIVNMIPFSRREFEYATHCTTTSAHWGLIPEGTPRCVYDAVAFFVHCRQSRAGVLGDKASFATLTKNRLRRNMNEQVSAWLSSVEGLADVHERMKTVLVESDEAKEVIRRTDSSSTCFYLDPPYLHETRTTTGEYEHEMTETQHFDLLKLLSCIKGKFLLSGYHSPMYDRDAERFGWKCHEFKIPNNAAGGKSKRVMTECVWTNF